jgi:predicted dienelactone hydrolase
MRRLGLLASLGILLWSATTIAAEQAIALAGLQVTLWSSPDDARRPKPIIVFSHGFHGCATQSRFPMEAFAAAGYLVFAPNHRDAACSGGHGSWTDRPPVPFRDPQSSNADTFSDRAADIRRLIVAIGTDARFRREADLGRIALAQHSLGGYTVLGLAGAWPDWNADGVRAVLALSPYSQAFIVHKTPSRLSAPVMYQGGTRDFGTTPAIQKTSGAYDQSPAPKYLVEFDGATHFAWTNPGAASTQKSIAAYSVAFMDRYLKGAPTDATLTNRTAGVATLKYATKTN